MIESNLETLQRGIHTTVQHQRTCKTCFMNGKSCSYQKEIDSEQFLCTKPTPNGKIRKAFFLMPFRTLFDQVYQTQFEPHLAYCCEHVTRADDITMTGFVICEKICRQIQESSLIAAELTFDNPNVFYELGVAYALNKNIAIFVQRAYEKIREGTLSKLNIPASVCNFYVPFSELKTAETRLWNVSKPLKLPDTPPENLHNPVVILLGDPTTLDEPLEVASPPSDHSGVIPYPTNSVCAGAIHKALGQVERELGCEGQYDRVTIQIGSVGGASPYSGGIRTAAATRQIQIQSAGEIEQYIRHARCVIVCASPLEPATYFWMGFAHGLEKHVIPVTVEGKDGSRDRVATPLPFDVRALWHIYVSCEHIERLQGQMAAIYKIILEKGKDTVNRREFWGQVLGSGSVSIFVGSVEYSKANRRHVVGEWDYRTVSEVINYLNSTKENMETVIQTPIFQISQRFREAPDMKTKELRRLEDMLSEKQRNAIIVGSADVNDMTDYVLARFGGEACFEPDARGRAGFCGIVAFKHRGDYETFETPSVYFTWLEQTAGLARERGFYDVSNGEVICQIRNNKYASTTECDPQKGYACLHSHVAKFTIGQQCIIVIQGISGPGTFGLAQLLTGAKFRQFTAFSDRETNAATVERLRGLARHEGDAFLQEFYAKAGDQLAVPDIERYSELMVAKLNSEFVRSRSVEAVVRVFVIDPSVGDPSGESREGDHDERRVLWWRYALPPRAIHRPKQ